MSLDASLPISAGRVAPELLRPSPAAGLAESVRGRDASDVARGFEEILATTLVREMRRSLPEGFFGGGAGADTYDGWLDEHVGQALAEREIFGLAGMIKAALGRGEGAR